MNRKKRNNIGVIGILLFFLLLFLCYFIVPLSPEKKNEKSSIIPTVQYEKVHLFQKLNGNVLYDTDGKEVNPFDSKEISVFLFWASWCSHCVEEISKADTLAQTAQEEGAKFYLVDKLDYEKESKQQAWDMLKDKQVNTNTYFDEDCKFYKAVGLNMIPTIIITDTNSRILSMLEGSFPTEVQLKDMIAEAKMGKSAALLKKIVDVLMNKEGGIQTNYISQSDVIPSGEDVLSESQGILMEYAALTENKELFSKLWNYVQNKLFSERIMPWVISTKSNTTVNALVDDLRIIGALQISDNMVENKEEVYKKYLDSIFTWNTENGKFVDFYDISSQQKADRFTLCYGDLNTLESMKKVDKRFETLYNNTLDLIQKGVISEKFPLYYSYYDYTEGKYKGDRLNMAEELTTLLHLAEVGKLPQEALNWIWEELEKGCVYAAYDLEGNPAQDGYFESTSVYALIVMIALLENREDIAGKAMNRMEQFRITNSEEQLNGLFGNSDGTGIYSFDQGMALLAYEFYERRTQ